MPTPVSARNGFTLLEVLVAFAILSIAVVSLIELTSQGLRLLKISGDHQIAVQLADRLAMETQVSADDVKPDAPLVDSGEDGNFAWERRITRIPLPDEIETRATIPGKEVPGLYAVSIAVRWGRNQTVEVATLRAPSLPTPSTATAAESQGQEQPQGQGQGQAQGQGQNQAQGKGQGLGQSSTQSGVSGQSGISGKMPGLSKSPSASTLGRPTPR